MQGSSQPTVRRFLTPGVDVLPLLLYSTLVAITPATAAEFRVRVTDATGAPVENAVVMLDGGTPASAPPSTPRAVMDQRGKQFVPTVLSVRTGTKVSFPNSDDIRHHVYSFSEAKAFELRLYEGTPTAPVLFDRPGVVVLGCNIHDWMLGYILVSNSPWFAQSDENGAAVVAGLAPGRYVATLWHPWLEPEFTAPVLDIEVTEGIPAQARVELRLGEPPQSLQSADPLQGLFRGQ